MDAVLTEALGRLDGWLVEVSSREERRGARLAPTGAAGWAGVRALARPSFAELALDAAGTGTGTGAGGEGDGAPPALVPPGDHPLARAAAAFDLAPPLVEALLVLLAPHLEPRYRALYGVLQDDTHPPGATERLLLTVLGRTVSRRRALYEALSDGGRLVGAGLIVPAPGSFGPLGRPFDLAPEVRAALLGLAPETALPGPPVWQPAAPAAALVAADPRDGAPRPPSCAVIFGPGEWGALAARVAGPVPGLLVGRAPEDKEAATRAAAAWWRAAALRGGVAVVDVADLEPGADSWVAEELLRRVARYGGRVIVRARGELPLPVPHVEAPPPTFAERRGAWAGQAASRGLELAPAALDRLAACTRLPPGDVARAFDGSAGPTEEELTAAARRLSDEPIRHGVRVQARRGLGDLVVRESTRRGLERLIYFAQNRDRVIDVHGLGPGLGDRRGPLVLFSGLSGTGKTLAAEAVASALGRALYVIDLSQLVSKYIGDTEKHIDQVLSQGERAGAALFFDEADAMFAARTEQVSNANDRFANLGVGFLLQRIERHDGVVILATNLRHAIDPAFLRRFHFRVEFPFPEVEQRRQIWERVLPARIPRADDLDLRGMAQRHRLSGGEIRNAALKAIFLAEEAGAPLGKAILEKAVALELLELGRLIRNGRRDGGDSPSAGVGSSGDTGALLRRFTEALETLVDDRLRERFTKEIHIVHGPPTREALSGRRPAVSLAFYRMASPRTGGLRLGFVISAWSHCTEEEHELLGAVHDVLCGGSLRPLKGRKVSMRVQESHDFDLLHRFWSSHGHPVRASVVLEAEIG